MKKTTTKEYSQRVKAALRSNFISVNMLQVEHGAELIDWTKEKLEEIYRRTRKLIIVHGVLYPCSNVERLYLPRAGGGRGFLMTKDCAGKDRSKLGRSREARFQVEVDELKN